MGRGFYTYCPGPPAPFLRVEYYNPSERWKVKRSLEQGLDVDALFRPDPRQYTTATGYGHVHADESALLRFHCYEAHIPYTMQVFKDYNLAGLSYIHVQNPRFRALPKQKRQTFAMYAEEQGEVDTMASFLESNATQYLWPTAPPSAQDSHTTTEYGHSQSSITRNKHRDADPEEGIVWHAPPPRETVCDVELDVHVSDILNVLDIITEQQGNDVHWRAVPSLRELWAEERQRMARLLPETDENMAFTLAVKTPKTAQPGTGLAVQGMERLLGASEGFLAQNFHRSVQQILQRYEAAIENVDVAWRLRHQKLLASALGGALSPTSDGVLTPDFSQALNALDALGHGLQEKEEDPDEELFKGNHFSATQSDPTVPLSMQKELSQRIRFDNATQSYYNAPMSKLAASERELTQMMERGEAVLDGPFRHVDDFIDPATLRPYELLEDEDSIDDEEVNNGDKSRRFERVEAEMQVMATQTYQDCEEPRNKETKNDTAVEQAEKDEESTSGSEEEALLALEDSSDDEVYGNIREMNDDKPADDEDQLSKPRGQDSGPVTSKPPQRKALDDADLLSLTSRNQVPSWLVHTDKYLQERNEPRSNGWFPRIDPKGIDVCLVRVAPKRSQVIEWMKKDSRKRKILESSCKSAPKRLKDDRSLSTKHSVLELNFSTGPKSHKLVPSHHQGTARKHDVEEVEWESTQRATQEPLGSQQSPTGQSGKYAKAIAFPRQSQDSQDHGHTSQSVSEPSPGQSRATQGMDYPEDDTSTPEALQGIGNQGGRLWVEGGGTLKAKTHLYPKTEKEKVVSKTRSQSLATPVSIMSVEIHCQCRYGRAGHNDSKQIAMVPNAERDKIFAVVYVFARDPGGGEKLEILERGCIFVPVERELSEVKEDEKSRTLKRLSDTTKVSIPRQSMGLVAPLSVDCVEDERKLLLRLSAKVFSKDPDMLLSWDPQGSGLGYIVERGVLVNECTDGQGKVRTEIDMARLLGRLRKSGDQAKEKSSNQTSESAKDSKKDRWRGSGLGKEWDERVGPGVAAASIEGRLVFSTWKLVSEEVKHPNASYLQAVVSSVLNRRIPFHEKLRLTQWYGNNKGRERWRVLHHKLTEATAGLLLIDALDIVGRAGEAARLSGVEFSQSFPGIRGSQYKVEGVLLRALKSLNSFERGSKQGVAARSTASADSPFSAATKSQSQESEPSLTLLFQSPWKARRRAHLRKGDDRDNEKTPFHNLSDRAYFFFSPSLDDTNKQEALEVQALTLEPESGHIEDPVVVCDFTALYPVSIAESSVIMLASNAVSYQNFQSLIIAYNLCFSTCAGQLEYHSTRGAMAMQGRTTGKVGPMTYPEDRTATAFKHHLKPCDTQRVNKNRLYVAPSRSIFVSESVVKGVLPQVLDEMLSTRAMLKKAAKQYKKSVPNLSPAILRQLEARQLALKYVGK
eukprot:scaffold2366_cov159-Amphora_coffeaeformis.AAC.2